MGTHPIFESDFDCLTVLNSDIMSTSHLQWAIINKFSAFDLKRAGRTWTKEPGHLNGRKSLRFNTLVEKKGLKVAKQGAFRKDQTRAAVKKASAIIASQKRAAQ